MTRLFKHYWDRVGLERVLEKSNMAVHQEAYIEAASKIISGPHFITKGSKHSVCSLRTAIKQNERS